jgi:hypothetical protein
MGRRGIRGGEGKGKEKVPVENGTKTDLSWISSGFEDQRSGMNSSAFS